MVEELEQLPGDIRVDKYRISGFWGTALEGVLRNLDVKTLLLSGVNTEQCVMHTLADTHFLRFNCILLEDCCGTTSPTFCTQATLFNVRMCFGFVTESKAVMASLPG